jgi:phage terminase small subunit
VIALPALKSVKQEKFCLHYAETGNATESYKKAGYSAKNDNVAGVSAAKLLRNTKIQERLQEIADELKSEKIADIAEIQEYLTSVMRREHCEHTVVVLSKEISRYAPDENGTMRKQTVKEECPQIVPIPARLSDANKAAETLARMQGGFDNKLQVEMTIPVFGGESELED